MRLVIVATAAAALSLAACGRKEETPRPGVKVSGNGVTVTGRDGVTVRTGADVKVTAPDFAPLYPGARATTSVAGVTSPHADSGGMIYSVEASPDEVLDFYRLKAKAAGFKPLGDLDMGAAKMFTAKDEATRRTVQVIVSPEGAGSSVSLNWTLPKG